VDRGFATEGLVAMRVTPDPAEYPDRDARDRFVRELGERLAAIPGVRVSATNQVPLSGSNSTTTYAAERLDREPEEANVIISVGLPNYLSLMEIPLLSGRGFASTDARDAPHVGIVNEAMARSLWPGESALGKRLRPNEESPWVEVIGVAANVQHQGLAIEVEPKLYVPAPQNRRSTTSWVLRIEGDVAAASDLARVAVASVSPTTPVRTVQILEETISDAVAVPRFRTLFVAGLAGLAAVLALLGVYGVVAFSVTQRTREIGVRMALGARSTGVVREVLGSGLRLALAGVGAGLVIAWPAGRMIDDFLFGIAPTDPLTYVTIALAVTAVSGLAAYLPARRAAHVDPIRVLSGD
jgi:predicted permease